jgi:hypothetical protein|tara:strand:+ start:480 stop:629 length:150 start_codon:yes stop_codon:yes gene_type:complete
MKLISPNGKNTINAHPDSVEYLLKKGWKEEATLSPKKEKLKSSSKENEE